MIINGKEYKFKNVKMGELREIRKWFANNMTDWSVPTEKDSKKAHEIWKELCGKIFETVDEELDLDNIPRSLVFGIPASFFLIIPEAPNEQKNS